MWSQPCKRATYYTTVHRMVIFPESISQGTLIQRHVLSNNCKLSRWTNKKTLCSMQWGVSLHGNIVHVARCSITLTTLVRYSIVLFMAGYMTCPYGIYSISNYSLSVLAQDVTSWSSWDATITPQLFKAKSKIHVNNYIQYYNML